MLAVSHRPRTARAGIMEIPVDEIDPNPNQPRRRFFDEELRELSESIAAYGILNPISVRLFYGRYEVVAGERRLRAAKLAGLSSVPCIVLDVDMEQSSLLAMVENLQRQDLDFIEEAVGLQNVMRMFAVSQEELARKLGRSQSAVANKLRLLKLPQDVQSTLREKGLTERHGRALLRLETPEEQREALAVIAARGYNVAQTDAYIERRVQEREQKKDPGPHKSFILKDVRVFLNTLSRSIDMMKQGGIDAGMDKKETDDAFIVTISIPKNK